MITQQRVKELLSISLNGEVTHNRVGEYLHGRSVGTLHHGGYLVHTVDSKQYNLHRLIFLFWHGYLPAMVDHYDQIKTNNSISNLVPSNVTHNGMNRRLNKNNTSGYVGVVRDKKRGKWKAQIKVNGKQISIGNFTDISEAVKARKVAEAKHGFCLNHGLS